MPTFRARGIARKRQPAVGASIDRGNPLGRTVTHCIPLGGENREIVTGTPLSFFSGGGQGVDSRGRHLTGTGIAACASVPIDLSAYDRLSISFWMYWDAYATDDDLAMEFTPTANTNKGFFLDPNFSGGANFHTAIGDTGGTNAVTFGRPTAAAWHHYVYTMDRTQGGSSNAHKLWVDGVSFAVAAQQSSTVVSGNFANNTLYLLSRNNASLFGAGRLQNIVIRGGYLMSASEAVQEYERPWQIFEKQNKVFSFASAGGGVSAALTGQGIALAQGSTRAAINAPITGQSALLAVGAVAVATSGVSAALTGQGVTVATGNVSSVVVAALAGQSIPVSAGAITANIQYGITGQSVTRGIGSISAAVSPTLSGHPLTATVGNVDIGGDIIRALAGQNLTVSVGVLGIAGIAVREEISYAPQRKTRAPNFAPRKIAEEPKINEAEKPATPKPEPTKPEPKKPGVNRLREDQRPDIFDALAESAQSASMIAQKRIQLEIEQQEIRRLFMYNVLARAALLAA